MADHRPAVLVVSPYRDEYGPQVGLKHVVEALATACYRVICAIPPETSVTPELERDCTAIERIPELGTFPRTLDATRLRRFFRQHLRSADEIAEVGRRYQVSAVYSRSEAIFAGALAAKRLGVPSIVHVVGMSIRSPRIGANVYVRFLARMTTHFVACSSAVAEMLALHGADERRITVIHNGISIAEIDAAEGAVERSPGERYVGMVAAFDPRKGHELFVEAAAILAQTYPDLRFFFIGGSLTGQPKSAAFERQINVLVSEHGLDDRFVTTGHLAPAEVFRWMRSLDVVVVPSRTEAFAHALLEAMACSRPAVASAVEGNLDAFVHGHSGLYAERSAAAFAAAISRLLDDPDLARRLGAAGRERVAAYFDLPVTLPVIAQTIDDVVSSHAAHGAGS